VRSSPVGRPRQDRCAIGSKSFGEGDTSPFAGPAAPVPSSASTATATLGHASSRPSSRTPSRRASARLSIASSVLDRGGDPYGNADGVQRAGDHPPVAAVVAGSAATSTPPVVASASRRPTPARRPRPAVSITRGSHAVTGCAPLHPTLPPRSPRVPESDSRNHHPAYPTTRALSPDTQPEVGDSLPRRLGSRPAPWRRR